MKTLVVIYFLIGLILAVQHTATSKERSLTEFVKILFLGGMSFGTWVYRAIVSRFKIEK